MLFGYAQLGHHHVVAEWMRRRCAALALACSGSCGAAPTAWEATLQLLENQVCSSPILQAACLACPVLHTAPVVMDIDEYCYAVR
jgi:hypothetical protein